MTERDGMRTRREVLGDAYVDGVLADTGPLGASFQDLITRYAWGEVWSRPGLDRGTRSCVAMTALIAGGRLDELRTHVRGALRNGVAETEIRELILMCAVYCGVPAANAAVRVAEAVLAEWREAEEAGPPDAAPAPPPTSPQA